MDVFFNQQVIGSLDSGIIYDAIEAYQNIKFVENTDIPSLNFTLEPGAQITFNDIFSESIVNMISNHHYTYIFPSIASFFFILSVFAVNHLAKLLSKYLKDIIIDVGYVFIVFALWLLGQKFINHTILLVLSIGLLVRFIYNDIHNKSFFSLISSTVLLCLLTAITNFSPKEYTGELIYTATPSTNVSTYITYDNNNTFERLETTVQSNGLNFEILPTLGNAENIVINFSQSEPQQHSLLVEIDRLNIYCNNFLIDSITGSDLASSCRSLLNLQLIDSSRKSLYLEWNVDDYAQICLNSTFSNRLVSAQNGNFINLLSAVYYTLTILIFIRICNYIIYALKNRHYISSNLENCLFIILLAIISLGEILFVESLSGNFPKLAPISLALNIILLLAINTAIFSVTNIKIAALSTGIFSGILGIANYYTLLYRGSPILPWDVYSVNTAIDVMSYYNIYITWEIFYHLLFIVFPIIICFLFCKFFDKAFYKKRCGEKTYAFIISIICMVIFTNPSLLTIIGVTENVYMQKDNYEQNGFLLATALNMKYLNVEKPDLFSEEKVTEIFEKYQVVESTSNKEDMPHIVIIVNESFADLQSIYPFVTNTKVMPFINSLSGNNVAKGTCYVSQNGGGTCNSEYEFLMGSTMAFFPTGSIIFQQHMSTKQYSIINLLNHSGYTTIGMHPMAGSNWNRTEAYPLLQFQKIFFHDDLDNIELLRGYASDNYCYQWIIDQFENKTPGEKLAIYNLTVQNHGGYEYEGYTGNITVKNLDSPALEQYLSLMYESDKALEKLLTYFSGIDDKVIVLFLGDHQPALSSIGIDSDSNALPTLDNYSVPYVLWNNYDETMDVPEKISVNYLATYLLKNSSIPRSPYYLFLEDMSKEISIINVLGYEENGIFYTWDEAPDNDWIDYYKIVQYGLNSNEISDKDKFY